MIEKILNKLPRFHKNPGLSRIKLFVEENRLKYPPYNIVIAGTNGKGSVASMMESVLQLSGYDVGVLRSPHIYDPCERISFNSENIDKSQFSEILEFCLDFYRKRRIKATLADITTAIALYYFSKVRTPHISILEVGMGGRLDPVNIVPRNISIIIGVGRDHTAVLGEYPWGPAKAKSGVIKPGVPLITAESNKEALKIFRKSCIDNKSEIINIVSVKITGISDRGTGFEYKGREYLTSMIGYEQGKNASISLESIYIMRESGFNIPDTTVVEGFKKSRLPWRMELFSKNPAIIFDGAHNREGWENLRHTLQFLSFRNLHLVLIIRKSKFPGDFPRDFPGKRVFLHIPEIHKKSYFNAGEINKRINDFRGTKINYDNIGSAMKKILKEMGSNDLLLITGSFGTASNVRNILLKIIQHQDSCIAGHSC